MIEIRALENTPISTLHAAFLSAFSDYAVPMQMPLAGFCSMLFENGFSAEASVGAFDGDSLVGFVFCARRYYQGKQTLYDCGTGVIPGYRDGHIGTQMLSALTSGKKAGRFVLEVLQQNAPAVTLYRNRGFHTARELCCYRCLLTDLSVNARLPVLLTDEYPDLLVAQASGLWDHAPTWQNSTASLLRITSPAYAFVTDGAFLIGYGALNRANGSLMQLAVRQEFRGAGVASAIVYALSTACHSKNMHLINADKRDATLRQTLLAWGFSEYASQFEMELCLDNPCFCDRIMPQ